MIAACRMPVENTPVALKVPSVSAVSSGMILIFFSYLTTESSGLGVGITSTSVAFAERFNADEALISGPGTRELLTGFVGSTQITLLSGISTLTIA
ncbi:hypothetical protein D3C72_1739020 [compost metagenome]